MKIVRGDEGLREAAEWIREGRIVAYPTETFYGLGVDATNEKALASLVQLKGRPDGMPFPILVSDRTFFETLHNSIPKTALKLMDEHWPGPLTLVLSAPHLPKLLQGPSGGVGFRISAHPMAAELVRGARCLVTTTSANRTGQPAASSPEEIQQQFQGEEILLLDGGKTPGGAPSTVVDFTVTPPKVLRRGPILVEVDA